jgi:hypothetical protein
MCIHIGHQCNCMCIHISHESNVITRISTPCNCVYLHTVHQCNCVYIHTVHNAITCISTQFTNSITCISTQSPPCNSVYIHTVHQYNYAVMRISTRFTMQLRVYPHGPLMQFARPPTQLRVYPHSSQCNCVYIHTVHQCNCVYIHTVHNAIVCISTQSCEYPHGPPMIYYNAPELRHLVIISQDATPALSITIPEGSDPNADPDYSSLGTTPASVNNNKRINDTLICFVQKWRTLYILL